MHALLLLLSMNRHKKFKVHSLIDRKDIIWGPKFNKNVSYRRETAPRAVSVNSCYMFYEEWELETFQTAKVTFKVIQGHGQWC